jgi:hypothetical protein
MILLTVGSGLLITFNATLLRRGIKRILYTH